MTVARLFFHLCFKVRDLLLKPSLKGRSLGRLLKTQPLDLLISKLQLRSNLLFTTACISSLLCLIICTILKLISLLLVSLSESSHLSLELFDLRAVLSLVVSKFLLDCLEVVSFSLEFVL